MQGTDGFRNVQASWFSRCSSKEANRADPDRQKEPFSIAVTSIGEEAGLLASLLYRGGEGRGNKKGAHVGDRHTRRAKNKGARGRQECLCKINEPSAVTTATTT